MTETLASMTSYYKNQTQTILNLSLLRVLGAGPEITENFHLFVGQVAQRFTCPDIFILVYNFCQSKI